MIGSPEQEEEEHNGDDELDDSVLFGRPQVHQSGYDPRIANHHHQHGNHQTQNICHKQIIGEPVVTVRTVETADRLSIICYIREDESRQRHTDAQGPDERN